MSQKWEFHCKSMSPLKSGHLSNQDTLSRSQKCPHLGVHYNTQLKTNSIIILPFFSPPEGNVPPEPPRLPQLIKLPVNEYGSWRYKVNPGNTSLAFLQKTSIDLNITSFLFRVSHIGQDIITYYWQVLELINTNLARTELSVLYTMSECRKNREI